MARRRGNPRLEEKVRQDLSVIINYRLNDPRVTLVSVVKVELFEDNQFGNVYVSTLGADADKRMIMRALKHARGQIQKLLGRSLSTRHTPRLTFIYDDGIEKSVRVGAILRQIEDERAPDPVDEDEVDEDEGDEDGGDEDEGDEDEGEAGDEADGEAPEGQEAPEERGA